MSFLKDYEKEKLEETANLIVRNGKGILAADESTNTIGKRFGTINVENTEENRRKYRELLFTTPDLETYIGGTILYKETFRQSTSDGVKFIDILKNKGIKIGIKLDEGLSPYKLSQFTTNGISTLQSRAEEFKTLGADFAKWRCVYNVQHSDDDERTFSTPTEDLIISNSSNLADYALICQINGLVPIVEPEVLMDGDHHIDTCQAVTKRVLAELIYQLHLKDVYLPAVIIKPNMVLPGIDHDTSNNEFILEDIAHATIETLVDTIPISIPGIVFLSGGQSPEDAIERLAEINKTFNYTPWALTYSFGRAIQNGVLTVWEGSDKNLISAQDMLFNNVESCSHASVGDFKTANNDIMLDLGNPTKDPIID